MLMHFPKLVLSCGRFGGFGCLERAWVYVYEWKVPMNKPDMTAQLINQPPHLAVSAVAIRTLIVTVIDNGHARVGWTN